MGRLNYKKFVQFINDEFKRLEINNYEATNATRTYYTADQYERGACKLMVRFCHKEYPENFGFILCYYSLKEYQEFIDNGYKMYLTYPFRSKQLLKNEMEVEVKKS